MRLVGVLALVLEILPEIGGEIVVLVIMVLIAGPPAPLLMLRVTMEVLVVVSAVGVEVVVVTEVVIMAGEMTFVGMECGVIEIWE